MNLTKTLKATVAAAALAMTAMPASAANIAVIAGSIEDGFFNLIKKKASLKPKKLQLLMKIGNCRRWL